MLEDVREMNYEDILKKMSIRVLSDKFRPDIRAAEEIVSCPISEDLFAVPVVEIGDNTDSNGEETVTALYIEPSHLSRWKVNVAELLNDILRSDEKDIRKRPTIDPIGDLLGIGGDDIFYVLTNARRAFGAENILHKDILKKFAIEHGDFFILPSSVHEVLLLSDQGYDVKGLRSIVREINGDERIVAPADVLSDNVYYYSLKRGFGIASN